MIDYLSLEKFISSLNNKYLDYIFPPNENKGLFDSCWHDSHYIFCDLQEFAASLSKAQDIETIFSEILRGGNIDIGKKLISIENHIKLSGLSGNVIENIYRLLDVILAKTLHQIVLNKKKSSHPQNLRNILWYFYGRRVELLLIIESLLLIILDEEVFALEERGRASRVLLKNYRIENIFIYISEVTSFNHHQKEFIFSHLSAYQKVFRKIQEILFDKQKQKGCVAKIWFNKTLYELKENGDIPTIEYEIHILIYKLIECFIDGNDLEFENIGRSIVLVVENEEIIRYYIMLFIMLCIFQKTIH